MTPEDAALASPATVTNQGRLPPKPATVLQTIES
jgi:hypothetical protein